MNREFSIWFNEKNINITDIKDKIYNFDRSILSDKKFIEDVEVMESVYIEFVKILKRLEYNKLLVANENNEISDELALQKMFNSDILANPYFFFK